MRLRPTAPALLSLLCLAGLGACSGGAKGPPNVVLVTLDTTRADYLSTYGEVPGHPGRTTPTFDALGEDGIVFEHAVSTAAVTPVSHASILTGRQNYNHRLRVLSAASGYRLPADVPSLTSVLKAHGYRTAAVHSAFPVSAHFGFDRDFDDFLSLEAKIQVEHEEGGTDSHSWSVEEYQRRSDETTDLVLDLLEQVDQPFFLWIHYWDPHDVQKVPPDEFQAEFAGRARASWGKVDPTRYAMEVSWVDRQFGRVVDSLKHDGRYGNTIFAITADHGEGLGEHDWGAHRILYEEQIHVPLILRVPDGPRGARVPTLVRTIDLAPTILSALGIPFPGADGVDLLPRARGEAAEPLVAYADQINGYDLNAHMITRRPTADFLHVVMNDEWKLVYRPNHPDKSELFHLSQDPDEAVNHWDDRPAVRRELLLDLARRNPWITSPFQPEGEVDPALAARTAEALDALGYTGGEAPEAPSEEHWRWTCVDHSDVLELQRGQCPRCELPLLLTRKP